MLNKEKFIKSLNALLVFCQIDVDEVKTNNYYNLMANDFNDDEFTVICGDICKTENLYNKYPQPKLFYDRKPKIGTKDKMTEDLQKFIEKVDDYISSGFIYSSQKEEFNNSLTDTERKVLTRNGGISALWTACNRDDYARSVDSVLRGLESDFKELWEFDTKQDGGLKLTYYNQDNVDKLKQLTSGAIKRIGA